MAIFRRKKTRRKKTNDALMKRRAERESRQQLLSRNNEGELAIDAYETEKEFIIESTIAGITAKDLDISIEDDMLIIKGKREKPERKGKKNYFQQECFWGPFSKKIILPETVKITQAKATVKNGILSLNIPKTKKRGTKKIAIENK